MSAPTRRRRSQRGLSFTFALARDSIGALETAKAPLFLLGAVEGLESQRDIGGQEHKASHGGSATRDRQASSPTAEPVL